jgi:phytoene dehydrogenase-like protein
VKPDVVVLGGGHNALVAAALMAKGGLKPLVLERRDVVGGAAVTEEIHPGFKVSAVAHTAGPLRPALVRELGLLDVALSVVEPEARVYAPIADGRGLSLWADPQKTCEGLRRHSAHDAESYVEFHRSLTRVSELLARMLERTPPDLARPGRGDVLGWLGFALRFRALGRTDANRLFRWAPMAVADFASEWFDSEPLKAVIAARGIRGAMAGPFSAGTTANLLLQAAVAGGNAAGSATMVVGGMGALAEALGGAARRFGAQIRTRAEVERITTRDGAVTGVVLKGGEELPARAVVSGTDPQRTCLRLLDPGVLDPDDLRWLRNYRQEGMASKVNLALSAMPTFRGMRSLDAPALLQGRIHVGADVDTLERAFDDAKYGRISEEPYLDITIPSLSDPTLAPPGAHVMSVYVQYTPYRLRSGDWEASRSELGDRVLRMLEEFVPGLSSLVLARQVLTPVDLERIYGLTGGHPFHGEPSLDQLFVARPLLGWSRYRTPVRGLYLCSAATHPGGGVTGLPGANAAREVLKDLR